MKPTVTQECPVCWKQVRYVMACQFSFYASHRDTLERERCPMSWKPYELTGPYTIDSIAIGTLRGVA